MRAALLEQDFPETEDYAASVFHPCQAKDCSTSRSYYYAEVNGTVLSYCGHHATEYEVKLLAASHGRVRDYRHLIAP